MSHGEYVAIESLESLYGVCPFIAPNGILVYGDSFQNELVGVVLIKESYVKNWAQNNNIDTEYSKLVDNKELKTTILNHLKGVAKEGKKKNF